MRIVLFGSGSPQSVTAFQQLSRQHDIGALVVPRATSATPLVDCAEKVGIQVLRFEKEEQAQDALSKRLRAMGTDLLCIASFPYRLRGALISMPTVNLHMSILPRHRGADPVFWTYYYGEQEAGVSVHWVDAQWDHGDIVLRRPLSIPLGKPSRQLYFELCDLGSQLLLEALRAIAAGQASRVAQDEAQATFDPPPKSGTFSTDFARWPVRRAWHFLAGLSDQRHDLLAVNGARYRHGRAVTWDSDTSREPGTIVQKLRSIRVYCGDGAVTLERSYAGLFKTLRGRFAA